MACKIVNQTNCQNTSLQNAQTKIRDTNDPHFCCDAGKFNERKIMAGVKALEPAASGVTGRFLKVIT